MMTTINVARRHETKPATRREKRSALRSIARVSEHVCRLW